MLEWLLDVAKVVTTRNLYLVRSPLIAFGWVVVHCPGIHPSLAVFAVAGTSAKLLDEHLAGVPYPEEIDDDLGGDLLRQFLDPSRVRSSGGQHSQSFTEAPKLLLGLCEEFDVVPYIFDLLVLPIGD